VPIELVDGEIRTSGHLVGPTGRRLDTPPEPQNLPTWPLPLTVAPELPLTWAALEESMSRVYDGLRVPAEMLGPLGSLAPVLLSFRQSMRDLNLQMEETANLYFPIRSMPSVRASSMQINFGLLYGMDLGFDKPSVVVLPAPVMLSGPSPTMWERLLMDSHFD